MPLPLPFNAAGASLQTTPWQRREPGGIYVGHNKQVWLYREFPLVPLRHEDADVRLRVGRQLKDLLDDLGSKSKDFGQGMRILAKLRSVHLFMTTFDSISAQPVGTPPGLAPFLEQMLDQITSDKTLLIGIQLQSSTLVQATKARGGLLNKAKVAMTSASDDVEGSLDAYRDDYADIDQIFRRHNLHEARPAALAQLESWFNQGVTADAPLAFDDESFQVLGGREYEISAVTGFERTSMRAPYAQWLMDASTHYDPAVAISVRADLEPASVTRNRIRRQRRKLIAQDKEEQATGDIGREENSSVLAFAEDLETYVRESRTPWLTNTSVLMARVVRDVDDTYADMLRSVYQIDTKPLEHRQLEALHEMAPTSSARVNPFPQDVNPAMIAHAGMAGFSTLGDPVGVMLGRVDPDDVPFYVNPFATSQRDLPPVMGVFGDPGSGKSQPLDAKVLTPSGWTTMGSLSVGDPVIGSDGQTHQVTGIFPQGELPVFRVTFNDGSSTECSEDHLWSVATSGKRAKGRDWQTRSLAEIRDSILDGQGKRQWRIPVMAPVDLPPADLPLDPYLVGVLIGAGNLTQHVNVASVDDGILDEVRRLLPAGTSLKHLIGCDYQIQCDGVRPHPMKVTLLELGLWGRHSYDKAIPEAYKWGSVTQRQSLLQGLLDTDGTVSGPNTVVFSTSSAQLAADVAGLAQSLGGTARTLSKVPTYDYLGEGRTERRAYNVTLTLPAHIRPFRLERKAAKLQPRARYQPSRSIAEISYVGDKPAQCIAVSAPDRLYVTDDFIVTHNTFACQLIAGQAVLSGLSAVFINPKGYDTLSPWATWVAEQGQPAQVVSMSEVEDARGGAFDPWRFCPPQMAAEILTRHILTVLGDALTPKQQILLADGLSRGSAGGARCAMDALAYVVDPEIIELVTLMARSDTRFGLAFGRVEQPSWDHQGGLLLIEFDRELPLPKAGKDPRSYEQAEKVALAVIRLVSRAALEILMRANGGVLVVDEAHHLLGSPEGLAILDRLAREGRSLGLLPIFATQRVTDLLEVDMESFMSRVLALKLNDAAQAAAAIQLCRQEVTEDRIEWLRTGTQRRVGNGMSRRLGLFRDLDDRHARVTIGPVPEHLRLAMSTNRNDRELRAAQDVPADATDPETSS